MSEIKQISRLLDKHNRIKLFIVVCMMVVGALLETLGVSLLLPLVSLLTNPAGIKENRIIEIFIDLLKIQTTQQLTVYIFLLLIFVFLFKSLYLIFLNYAQYRFVYNCQYRTQQYFFKKYLDKQYEYFFHVSSAQVIRLISNDIPYVFAMLNALMSLFTETIIAAFLICFLLIISPRITLTLIIIVALLSLAIQKFFYKRIKEVGKEYRKSSEQLNSWILQAISSIKEVKAFQKESYFAKKADKWGKKYSVSVRKDLLFKSAPKILIEGLCTCVILFLGVFYVMSGNDLLSIFPVISALAVAMIRLLPSASRISTYINEISYYTSALEAIDVLMREFEIDDSKKVQGETDFKSCRKIEIRNLYYRYPDTDNYIFENINFEIESGQEIGIIGISGAGKTTFVDIMLGLLEVERGDFYIDEHKVSQTQLGYKMGYIPQTISLINGSIKENVAFGIDADHIDEGKLAEAIQEAQLAEFIAELPDGLNTQVGERGIRLSGGQRQRIGIARALYTNPDILIFDEATSALDQDTETALMEAINYLHGRKTILIVAHRIGTLKNCDFIYRVCDGKIEKTDKTKIMEVNQNC